MAALRAQFRYFGGFETVSQKGEASRNASPKECSRCLFTAPFYVVAPHFLCHPEAPGYSHPDPPDRMGGDRGPRAIPRTLSANICSVQMKAGR